MKNCFNCGEEIEDNMLRCHHCGQEQQQQPKKENKNVAIILIVCGIIILILILIIVFLLKTLISQKNDNTIVNGIDSQNVMVEENTLPDVDSQNVSNDTENNDVQNETADSNTSSGNNTYSQDVSNLSNDEIVDMINNNSNLPVEYLCKYKDDDSSLAEYNELINFMSTEYKGRDIEFNYYGYPNDEAEYRLGYVSLLNNKYNILGVTIGDNMQQAISKIESYGFTIKSEDNYYGITLVYEDFSIIIKSSGDSKKDKNGTVEEICISAKTEYLGNRIY